MEKRRLGQTEMFISPIGLGCMGFSHAYGDPTDRKTAVENIRYAHDAAGYDFFDTAECYTGINPDGTISYNEELVGAALHDIRDQVIIATKCGVHFTDQGMAMNSSSAEIRRAVEGSLTKLNTDYIDLYYQHRIDPNVEPETVAETMGELIKEGKIRAWGISETGEEYLRRANAVTPVAAIQNRYSMMSRAYESMFPVCEELGVTFVAFSPMANGFLTGAYKPGEKFDAKSDFRSRMPQYTEEGFAKAQKLLELIHRITEEKNASPAQISMAWMICRKPYIVPIPGSRKPERILENAGAGRIVLSAQEITDIDASLDDMEFDVFGGRR